MEPVTTTIAVGWGIGKVLVWGFGILTAGYVSKKAIDKFGSTPSNDLAQNGVPLEQQYQDHKAWLADRKKYIEEKTDDLFKDLKDRKKELEEENKKLAAQLEQATDPKEKAKLLAMISENNKEISKINHTMVEHVSKLNKSFEEIGKSPLTFEQFQSRGQQANLASWKNWGIIAVCAVIAIMVISFVRKMLSKLASSFG